VRCSLIVVVVLAVVLSATLTLRDSIAAALKKKKA
jgi:hypothetical protein